MIINYYYLFNRFLSMYYRVNPARPGVRTGKDRLRQGEPRHELTSAWTVICSVRLREPERRPPICFFSKISWAPVLPWPHLPSAQVSWQPRPCSCASSSPASALSCRYWSLGCDLPDKLIKFFCCFCAPAPHVKHALAFQGAVAINRAPPYCCVRNRQCNLCQHLAYKP